MHARPSHRRDRNGSGERKSVMQSGFRISFKPALTVGAGFTKSKFGLIFSSVQFYFILSSDFNYWLH
jgi:hypothetical protein